MLPFIRAMPGMQGLNAQTGRLPIRGHLNVHMAPGPALLRGLGVHCLSAVR